VALLQVLSDVLVECGGNIDAAILRLGGLSLSNDNADATAVPHFPEPAPSEQRQGLQSEPASSTPAVPQTAEQWVEYLVQELAQASDMQVAKVKARSVLQSFEGFVTHIVKQVGDACLLAFPLGYDVPFGHPLFQGHEEGLQPAKAKLQEENTLLKKAVQIQHRQLQERAQQAEELTQMRGMLTQYQEQVRTLEINNYSLALHLQKATCSGAYPHQSHNPDIF
jgi:hypothetical protein